MTTHTEEIRIIESAAETSSHEPTLAEDLLLLLFQPDSGTIAGESTLFYVLGGAVLTDLALGGHVTTTTTRSGMVTVQVVDGRPPSDDILRSAWERIGGAPHGVQSILAMIGPALRQPLLARLVARDHIREEHRRIMGLFSSTAHVAGSTGRREALLAGVRAALVDGADAAPRIAALAALIWGSGSLPRFHRDIPWTTTVIGRAQTFSRSSFGAEAVARTTNAIIAGTVAVAVTAAARHH
ncbi:GOLPH3/VPS74 family protein [Microbacterium caowuchunii]|uniref:GPP34 family phosphoprotein n=1 Tax=Microbacterium caowuchunii TaxID=2614638 RepID=A0A5N0TM16_9MICO|nr:GPP34 family phosphoprotein [Microbacterium caowuchunii]KAA9136215.1 GPP34 family phosphoprotein [Microbacterium caowuchunii]